MHVSPVSSSMPIISDIHAGVAAARAAAAAVAFALALAAAELPPAPLPLPLLPLAAGAAAGAPDDDGEPASLADCCTVTISSTPRVTAVAKSVRPSTTDKSRQLLYPKTKNVRTLASSGQHTNNSKSDPRLAP